MVLGHWPISIAMHYWVLSFSSFACYLQRLIPTRARRTTTPQLITFIFSLPPAIAALLISFASRTRASSIVPWKMAMSPSWLHQRYDKMMRLGFTPESTVSNRPESLARNHFLSQRLSESGRQVANCARESWERSLWSRAKQKMIDVGSSGQAQHSKNCSSSMWSCT